MYGCVLTSIVNAVKDIWVQISWQVMTKIIGVYVFHILSFCHIERSILDT